MPGIRIVSLFGLACAALLALAASAMPAAATSRIKDLANIEGVRQNQLIGYGLVVGLNGTGDTLNNIPFTKQSLQAMLERMGVNIRGATIRTGNVAAVMVTGNLPPFGTQGTRMDVTVSALGDAKDLRGGTLLVTPLLGADGNVYAVAQGTLAISGFQAEGEAAKVVRGVPTVGRIANGAIIEREIEFAQHRAQRLAPVERRAQLGKDGVGHRRQADGQPDFLDRLADRTDAGGHVLRVAAEFKRERAVAGVDPPAGKDQCAACKHHRFGAFDEEELRHPPALPEQHERGGGDRCRHARNAQRKVLAMPKVPARSNGRPNSGWARPCIVRAQPGSRSPPACNVIA